DREDETRFNRRIECTGNFLRTGVDDLDIVAESIFILLWYWFIANAVISCFVTPGGQTTRFKIGHQRRLQEFKGSCPVSKDVRKFNADRLPSYQDAKQEIVLFKRSAWNPRVG